MTGAAMIEFLPDPLLIVLGNGETERANQAMRDLAAAHGLKPDLKSLFGRDALALLERARRDGAAIGFLPLHIAQSDKLVYRVSLRRMGQIERTIATFTDMTREYAWREQLGTRNRELGVLNDIGAALSSTLELDTVAERIYEQASRILNTENFYIALHDAETDTIAFPIRIENRQRLQSIAPRPPQNGLTEYVIRTDKPQLMNGDVRELAHALGLAPIGRPSQSWLGVPLIADGHAIGVIALQDHGGAKRYDEHDMEVLTLIAGQAAAAVRNAQLLASARVTYQELRDTQATLIEAERLRSVAETVGALNHEINNPLTAIAGNAQLLLRRAEDLPGDAAEKIGRMLEAAWRIQAVTSKMANLIHATSKRYPGNETILDVSGSTARDAPVDPPPGADAARDDDPDAPAEGAA
ncbi:MAG: GAF domain-containing protein [Candidatus Eisenbacteria bacterium]|uniref:GAF domain-containing protein n=1 Tax=Eiseniibacteriota bacterium TaxID=2212470 RepID=A0A9D6L7C7_UNCEI|nr:GAF domain-containing protein [Candidatus Eisenbacteria bacterium]MBI3540268.1 GAF domain-containing protein [Candidatus Eisenbacteria bacterium]